jgi:hypothetical protein
VKRGVVAFLILIGTLCAQQFPPPSDSGGSSGGNVTWGAILGSLNNQVDLNNALSGKLGYRGPWAGTTAYAANDVVTANGYGYMALTPNSNTPVSNTSVWLWFGSASSGSGGSSIAIPSAGIVKSNGTALLTAVAGSDYLTSSTGVTSINGQTGAVSVASTSPPASGMVKSNGSILQTAVAGTDYLSPSTGVTTFNGQSGAVTGVTTVNGQSGAVTVASTSPPASGMVKSNGTALATAVDGTDYLSPSTGVTSVNGSRGAISVITAPGAGIVKSSGSALQTAVAGTDYLSPTTGVTSVNGSTGAVTVATSTPPSAGMVKSSGTVLQTAVAGTDYLSPSTGVTSVNGSTGAVTVVTSVNGSTGAVTTVTAPTSGMVKSSGSALQTAVAGTDYMSPSTSVTTTQLPAVAKGKTCEIHIWGSGSGGALQVSDYEPISCFNDASTAMTITRVRCYADQGSTTTITPQITGSSSTSILTGALTCSNTFASGTLNGTPTLPSSGTIDLNITNPGLATFIRVIITGTF